MLCQVCQKRAANVHFTQIINNKKTEIYLCEQCADEKGQAGFSHILNISDFLSGYMGYGANEPAAVPEPPAVRCDVCGMSYEDFKKVGKLGCSNCYRVLGGRLKPVLRRLHGNVEHVGKEPGKFTEGLRVDKEIDNLRNLLTKAVQDEDYEKAAELRDKIKLMQSGGR